MPKSLPDEDELWRAWAVVKAAERPLLVIGKGAAYARSSDPFFFLVQKNRSREKIREEREREEKRGDEIRERFPCPPLHPLSISRVTLSLCLSYATAEPELREFVDVTGIPFLASPMGKGVVPDDHPLNVGGRGERRT